MDKLYLVLPSNVESFSGHKNTNVNFQTRLPVPLELTGRWEAGLTELFLPPAHLRFKYRFFYLQRVKKDGEYNTGIMVPIQLSIQPEQRVSTEPFFIVAKDDKNQSVFAYRVDWKTDKPEKYTQKLAKAVELSYKNKTNFLNRMATFPLKQHGNEQFFRELFDFRSVEHSINTNTKQGQEFMHSINRFEVIEPDRITITFKAIVIDIHDLGEELIIALPDYNDANTKLILEKLNIHVYHSIIHTDEGVEYNFNSRKDLYGDEIEIQCNIIEHSLTGEGSKRILRQVKRKHADSDEHIQYKNINYIPLATNKIDYVHVEIKSKHDYHAHLYDKLMLVLALQPQKL